MHKKIIFIVSALCSGGAFQSMGVYGVNRSKIDGSPEDNSQKWSNPYKIFLRMAGALGPNSKHPENNFKKLKKLTTIPDMSFIPRAQGIIKTLKVCVNKSPNILALSQELTESPYSRSFQEILGSELVKNDVDFIKKQMNGKGNNSSIQERIAKRQIDFLGFFEENYLFLPDQEYAKLCWTQIEHYEATPKTRVPVQLGEVEGSVLPQSASLNPPPSSCVSPLNANTPPPPHQSPPPPPPPPPPPHQSPQSQKKSVSLRKKQNVSVKETNSIFYDFPDIESQTPALSELLSKTHNYLVVFVSNNKKIIDREYPMQFRKLLQYCKKYYMNEGFISDNDESIRAFRVALNFAIQNENINCGLQDKLLQNFLGLFIDEWTTKFKEFPSFLQLINPLKDRSFKDYDDFESQYNILKNSINALHEYNQKKYDEQIKKLQEEEEEYKNRLNRLDQKLQKIGSHYINLKNNLRKQANFLLQLESETNRSNSPRLINLLKDIDDRKLDSYFMDEEDAAELETTKLINSNAAKINSEKQETENTIDRLKKIKYSVDKAGEILEFLKSYDYFYTENIKKINFLMQGHNNPEPKPETVSTEDLLLNPENTFKKIKKNTISQKLIESILRDENKEYAHATQNLIVEDYFKNSGSIDFVSFIKEKLDIKDTETRAQHLKKLLNSSLTHKITLAKKLLDQMKTEEISDLVSTLMNTQEKKKPSAIFEFIEDVSFDTNLKTLILDKLLPEIELDLLDSWAKKMSGKEVLSSLDTIKYFLEHKHPLISAEKLIPRLMEKLSFEDQLEIVRWKKDGASVTSAKDALYLISDSKALFPERAVQTFLVNSFLKQLKEGDFKNFVFEKTRSENDRSPLPEGAAYRTFLLTKINALSKTLRIKDNDLTTFKIRIIHQVVPYENPEVETQWNQFFNYIPQNLSAEEKKELSSQYIAIMKRLDPTVEWNENLMRNHELIQLKIYEQKIIKSWRTLNPEALDSNQNPDRQANLGGINAEVKKETTKLEDVLMDGMSEIHGKRASTRRKR